MPSTKRPSLARGCKCVRCSRNRLASVLTSRVVIFSNFELDVEDVVTLEAGLHIGACTACALPAGDDVGDGRSILSRKLLPDAVDEGDVIPYVGNVGEGNVGVNRTKHVWRRMTIGITLRSLHPEHDRRRTNGCTVRR